MLPTVYVATKQMSFFLKQNPSTYKYEKQMKNIFTNHVSTAGVDVGIDNIIGASVTFVCLSASIATAFMSRIQIIPSLTTLPGEITAID